MGRWAEPCAGARCGPEGLLQCAVIARPRTGNAPLTAPRAVCRYSPMLGARAGDVPVITARNAIIGGVAGVRVRNNGIWCRYSPMQDSPGGYMLSVTERRSVSGPDTMREAALTEQRSVRARDRASPAATCCL
jgi:hypothetical protein